MEQRRATHRGDLLALGLVLLLALLFRGLAADKYVFMDENVIRNDVINFFQGNTLIPTHFRYPTLFSYLAALATALYAWVLKASGAITDPYNMGALFAVDPNAIMPARMVSLGFGIATIIVVYAVGKRYFGRVAGLVAASGIAVSSLHVRASSLGLPDVTMTFFVAASLLFAFRAMTSRSTRDMILGGLFAGLATTTKYNGGMALIPLLFSFIIILKDEDKPIAALRNLADRRLVLCGLAAVIAFLAGSPGWLIEPRPYIDAFIQDIQVMKGGHLGTYGPTYLHHLALFWKTETSLAVLFGAGVVAAALRRRRVDLLVLSLIVPSYAIIGRWETKQLHYMLFLYPALALLGGMAISEIHALARRRRRAATLAPAVAVLLALGWPLASHLASIPRQLGPDNRVTAQEWIQRILPDRSYVIVDWAYIPWLPTEDQVSRIRDLSALLQGQRKKDLEQYISELRTYKLISLQAHLDYDAEALKKSPYPFLVTSSGCYERFFTTPAPPPGNPQYEAFSRRKEVYDFLFSEGPSNPWTLIKEFSSGKGPVIRIYWQNPNGGPRGP